MAFIDRRNKTKVYQDGSSLIAIGLTGPQAIAATGDAEAVAGWYGLGYMAGGDLGEDTNATPIKDESGARVGTAVSNDEFTIQNTTQQTDAVSLNVHKWLETNEAPVRYILPTPDPDVVQVHYCSAMTKDKGGRVTTSQGVRTKQFTLRGEEADHVFADVAADQSDWATEGLEDALDTVFAAA